MTGPRETALCALERCRRGGAWSDSVLDGLIKDAKLSQRDAALCSRLCYGVLQNRMLLDFYIDCFSKTPAKKLEPKLLDILRLSVCQLLFMDRIPPRAAVSEGVELCRKAKLDRVTGLCNAVLRKIADNRESLPQVPGQGTAEHLSIKYSHPLWLAEYFTERLGYGQAEALMAADNAVPQLTAQVNTQKTEPAALISKLQNAGAEAFVHPWLADCLVIKGGGAVSGLPGYNEGEFYIQDAAARLAVLAAAPQAGMRVLDACSAPGGKSFACAIAMKNEGRVLSCDIHKNKLSRVAAGAERMGLDIIATRVMDAKAPVPELFEAFDLVIADVPCSGLGVIRKKPDIRYKPGEELAALPAVQLDILRALSRCVAPGGLLLYSTCTLTEAENQGVARAFLDENGDFSAEAMELPAQANADMTEPGTATLWPHRTGTDGFFICKMRRKKQI